MIRLSLFASSAPDRLLDEREIEVGAVVIGRGADADWRLEDPECLLSRRHCLIGVVEGSVSLTDLSANGVFLDESPERCARGRTLPLRDGQTLRMGDYLIRMARSADEIGPAPASPILALPAPSQAASAESSRDCAEAAAPPSADHGVLLEAFFRAAHLDVSTFADEDPVAIMERLGGIYRETVLGLAGLMSERSAMKADYVADHTTVSNVGNNPFRWAAPQRLAVDLLKRDREGFMTGAEAVRASFGDIRSHLLCFVAGMRAAVKATLERLSPKSIEARLPGRAPLSPGHKAAWAKYAAVHDRLQREAVDGEQGFVSDEFRKGYAASLGEFESPTLR
jgi:predicted component of type VI protein secretion system